LKSLGLESNTETNKLLSILNEWFVTNKLSLNIEIPVIRLFGLIAVPD